MHKGVAAYNVTVCRLTEIFFLNFSQNTKIYFLSGQSYKGCVKKNVTNETRTLQVIRQLFHSKQLFPV
jgi:hypothetical protein